MQMAMFIFLKRQWDKDEKYLCQILRYFTDTNYPLQLLIFPEGTDFGVHSVTKSKSYALKNNLPIYKHVLHPRLKGFTYCVAQLREHHGIDAIYNVTVGYLGTLCKSEFDLAMGNFPHNVHFHLKRHPISSIPESTEGLEKWCQEKWAEKESTLEQFYKDRKFVPQEERSVVTDEASVKYQMIFWIVYWFIFVCVVFILLYNYWWVRWYTLITGLVLFLQSSYGGGFEELQVQRHAPSLKYNHSQNDSATPSSSKENMENGKASNKAKEHTS